MRYRHCFHNQPDPRCFATEAHSHPNPLSVFGGPDNIEHRDQAKVALCCRCGSRMLSISFVFLWRLWALFAYCQARPETKAADDLIASTAAAESR